MIPFSDIIAGARFRSDLQDTDRVLQAEWIMLANEAIESTWSLIASARPDFQAKFRDSVVASGGTASFNVPSDFFGEIDVVYGPDTTQEYSLGPFAWQNRRSPGGWLPPFAGSQTGATRARLQGATMYLEPSLRAGGTYRLWYCQTPKTCKFTVRLCTSGAALPAYTASGTASSHQLVANANGALTIDGVLAVVGDRVLVTTGASSLDNGIYTVIAAGSGGAPWALRRASDYTGGSTVFVGNIVTATEGTVNTNGFFELLTFGTSGLGTVDTDALGYTTPATIDPALEASNAGELIKIKASIPAIVRDEGDARPLQTRQAQLEGEIAAYWKLTRTSNVPQKMVDTDALGPRGAWGGGW